MKIRLPSLLALVVLTVAVPLAAQGPSEILNPQVECLNLHSGTGQGITAIGGAPLTPLRSVAFVPADFAAAANGAEVVEVTSQPSSWLGALPDHADAKWVALNATANSGSLLLSQPFVVPSCNLAGASIRFTFAADDALGDIGSGTPNPLGVYLNGVPIPGFFGAGFSTSSVLQAADISSLLVPGCNRLEVYVRDFGGSPTAVMYHAKICYPICRKVETFRLRSGNGGTATDSIIKGTYLPAPVNTALTGADFGAACGGAAAMVGLTPPAGMLASLGSDNQAKWIAVPTGSLQHYALFCHPFTISACGVLGARIRCQIAVYSWLGSSVGSFRAGLWINGKPLRGSIRDGQFGTSSSWIVADIGGCDLVSGANTLHVYVEAPGAVPMTMYSAAVSVFSCAQPEQIQLCSDASVTLRSGISFQPLQATPFSVANGDFVCPTPANVLNAWPAVWCPPAPCAQWLSATPNGVAGGSTLFCQQFTVGNCTGSIGSATLQLAYAVDDHLGDQSSGGMNPNGIYLNGQPLAGSWTTTGGPGQCRTLTRNVGSLLRQGANTLHVYCRDVAGGFSGAMWAGTITISPCESPNFLMQAACPWTELGLVATPFLPGATGTIGLGPLNPNLPFGLLILDVAAVPFPVPLAAVGAPACSLHVMPAVLAFLVAAPGNPYADYPLAVPANPAFVGTEFHAQGGAFEPDANALGIVFTPGMRLVVE